MWMAGSADDRRLSIDTKIQWTSPVTLFHPVALRLYDTLSGRLLDFAPERPPEVRLYVCGPTVYGRAHLGNFRSFVATDLLRRALKYRGWQVREVMNITDVDDRIIQRAQAGGQDLGTFTAPWIAAFLEDMETLRLERPEVMPRATEHIPEMVALTGD